MMRFSSTQYQRGFLFGLYLCGIGIITPSACLAAEPAIRIVSNSEGLPVAFEATGLPESKLASLVTQDLNKGPGLRFFSVHVATSGKPTDQPAMFGTYEFQGTAIRFTPQFSLRPGLNYRAVFRPAAVLALTDSIAQANLYRIREYQGKSISLDLEIPDEKDAPRTEISQVYPSSTVLPENQLKFYVHFSSPMSRGEAYEHLELLKGDGTPISLPFLELGEELWDLSGSRLTVLIDPGRIKQGVKPREDLGPVLEDGHEYTLVIHSNWKDARGNPLSKGFRKTFRAGPPLSLAIDTTKWKVNSPKTGSKEPLTVVFPRPLDHALLERTLTIRDSKQVRILGEIRISDVERRWEFHPDAPWITGQHAIVVDTVLEDLAGNRIGRAFEVDQVGPIVNRVEIETVSIPFTPLESR